ncbi:DUF4169 family protein [Thioclava sp. F36-7]|uniref:DUF4169 family protein n=1 Tax=Thioclava sp. F36-7 TaxID=1915317 RepID=UPI0009980B4F|nr:DUF4169 family protein [Thioclava sp. F36-7]OOY07304.1 DUF4169 domain-containing protein [Thioclava sp. F36-7]
MSKVTNLNQFRKQQARVKKREQGSVNAEKFGRSKAEKTLQERRATKERRDLDGHQREHDE